MHVVATAGHVDHGKSTLVRALTGIEPDRLAEEQRRGLTIELGYAWTTWPEVAADDAGEVAFVDVPGHERFIATTLAGLGPVPVALLVVAADDPWMPQAGEHLAALDALGVAHGVVAVTRSDLADPGPTEAEARRRLAGTGLRDAPVVAVSARTGAGLSTLRTTLGSVLAGVPRPDAGADVRLPLDRVFTVRGAGTVVTGTLGAGTVAVGDTLVTPDGGRVRVRAVESLGRSRDRVTGPARVALNLTGPSTAPELGLHRGDSLLTPEAFHLTTEVDVLAGPDLPAAPLLHAGTAQTAVRVRALDDATARLRLDRPLPLRVGDRVLLRDPGDRRVWRAEVVDPDPPALRGRGAARERAAALGAVDGSAASELTRRGVVRREALRRLGVAAEPLPAGTVEAAGWLLDPVHAVRLAERLRTLVDGRPDGAGPAPAEAARELGLPDAALALALAATLRDPEVRSVHGRLEAQRGPDVPPDLEAPAGRLAGWFEAHPEPFAAPDAPTLAELGLDARSLARLGRAGLALHLGENIVLRAGADAVALERLRGLPSPFTTSAARTELGTSRRVVLPLLALLDRTGRTVRLADDTRRLR